MKTYTAGTLVELMAVFTSVDEGGATVDPDTVTSKILLPNGTIVTPTPVRVGRGYYVVSYTPELNGTYSYRIEGDGAITAANEGTFMCVTAFPPV